MVCTRVVAKQGQDESCNRRAESNNAIKAVTLHFALTRLEVRVRIPVGWGSLFGRELKNIKERVSHIMRMCQYGLQVVTG